MMGVKQVRRRTSLLMGISLALLLGSAAAFLIFALPQYTLEKITVATRLAKLMVQAEPPISGDDRILLAILAGVGTTGIGWVLIDWLFFGRAGLSAFVRSRGDLYDDIEEGGAYRPSDPLDLVLPGPIDGAGSVPRASDARRPLSARTDIGDPPLSQPMHMQPAMPQPHPAATSPLSPFAAPPSLDDLLPPLDRLAAAADTAPNPVEPVSLLGLGPSGDPTLLDLGPASEAVVPPTLLDLQAAPASAPVVPQPPAAAQMAPPAALLPASAIPPISAWPPVPPQAPLSPPSVAPAMAVPQVAIPAPVPVAPAWPPAAPPVVVPPSIAGADIFGSFPPELPRHDASLIMPLDVPPAAAPAVIASAQPSPVAQAPLPQAPAPIVAPEAAIAVAPLPVAPPPVAPPAQVAAIEAAGGAAPDFTPDIFDRAPIEDLLNRLEGRIRQRRSPVRAALAAPSPEASPPPAPATPVVADDVVGASLAQAEPARRPPPPGFASTRLVEFPPPASGPPAIAPALADVAPPVSVDVPTAGVDGDDLLDQPLYIALERLRGLIRG
jgi:hypothetical protein